jgi:hypothetical protein
MAVLTSITGTAPATAVAAAHVRPSRLTDCASLAFGNHIAGVLIMAGRALDDPWQAIVCLVTGILVAALTIGYYVNWRRLHSANQRQLRMILRRVEGRG